MAQPPDTSKVPLYDYLAAAAAVEIASREKHHPAMIDAGEIGAAEAEADLAAWRAIGAMIALGPGPDAGGWHRNPFLEADPDLSQQAVEHATEEAEARLAERLGAAPDDQHLSTRLTAVRMVGRWLASWRPARAAV
jgi:hypothetical protein